MLYEAVKAAVDGGKLLSRSEFKPLPTIDDRSAWEEVDPFVRLSYTISALDCLSKPIPQLTAGLYAQFKQNGNREKFEKAYFARREMLASLVIGECIEDGGRYLNKIIDVMWAICEESCWVIPAHYDHDPLRPETLYLPDVMREPSYIDLFSAETGAILTLSVYLLKTRLTALMPIAERVEYEVKRRIINTYRAHPEIHWTGLEKGHFLNNWTPWIYSNLLTTALLSVDDAKVRNELVMNAAKGIDAFLATYSPDGACNEGPGYFGRAGASVLDNLELLYAATGGAVNVYAEPLIRNMADYIRLASINGEYFINFADAACRIQPDAQVLLRAAEKLGLKELNAFAAGIDNAATEMRYDYRRIKNAIEYKEVKAKNAPYPLSHSFEGTQVCFARENPQNTGLYFAAKGGNNNESHNHNDIGNFIVYADGEPFIIDVGVETYRRETFNEMRYTIWTMQSRYHNTAIIDGCDQLPGGEYCASDYVFKDSGEAAVFGVNMAPAYGKDAGVLNYKRTLALNRDTHTLALKDEYEFKTPQTLVLPLMCAEKPTIGNGEITILNRLKISFGTGISVKCEEIRLKDKKLRANWQREKLYRLLLTLAPASDGTVELEFGLIENM